MTEKKLHYEKPVIIDLSGSVAHAEDMEDEEDALCKRCTSGAAITGINCRTGGSPSHQCYSGSVASGGECSSGSVASELCKSGSSAQSSTCRSGSVASSGCKSGSVPGQYCKAGAVHWHAD